MAPARTTKDRGRQGRRRRKRREPLCPLARGRGVGGGAASHGAGVVRCACCGQLGVPRVSIVELATPGHGGVPKALGAAAKHRARGVVGHNACREGGRAGGAARQGRMKHTATRPTSSQTPDHPNTSSTHRYGRGSSANTCHTVPVKLSLRIRYSAMALPVAGLQMMALLALPWGPTILPLELTPTASLQRRGRERERRHMTHTIMCQSQRQQPRADQTSAQRRVPAGPHGATMARSAVTTQLHVTYGGCWREAGPRAGTHSGVGGLRRGLQREGGGFTVYTLGRGRGGGGEKDWAANPPQPRHGRETRNEEGGAG
jgi:hypothetical protein